MFTLAKRLLSTSFSLFSVLAFACIASLYYLKGLWYQVIVSIVLAFFGAVLLIFGIVALRRHFGNFWRKHRTVFQTNSKIIC
jgi:hypothetical protein